MSAAVFSRPSPSASSAPSFIRRISPPLTTCDWAKHKQLISDYLLYHARVFTDTLAQQQLQEYLDHQDNPTWPSTRAAHCSKLYYERLLREYSITDLSLYKQGKIGLRWRTPMEIIQGKGHFSCASKTCSTSHGLSSIELEFAFIEDGHSRRCLVKVRVCPACAYQVNYKKAAATQATRNGGAHRNHEYKSTPVQSVNHSSPSATGPLGKRSRDEAYPGSDHKRRLVAPEPIMDAGEAKQADQNIPSSPPMKASSEEFKEESPRSSHSSPPPSSAFSSPPRSSRFAVPSPRRPRIRTPEQQANLERRSVRGDRVVENEIFMLLP